MQFIPDPLRVPVEEALIRNRPFQPFGHIEEPDDVLLLENPFQEDAPRRYRYLCHCTTETAPDATAYETGGWYGNMRVWLLEPDTEPFTCPDCGMQFIPGPPVDPETEDYPIQPPLRDNSRQET